MSPADVLRRIDRNRSSIISRFGFWTGLAVSLAALIHGFWGVVHFFWDFRAPDAGGRLVRELFHTLDLFLLASLLSIIGVLISRLATPDGDKQADGHPTKMSLAPIEGLIIGLLVSSTVTGMLGGEDGQTTWTLEMALPRVALIVALSLYTFVNSRGQH